MERGDGPPRPRRAKRTDRRLSAFLEYVVIGIILCLTLVLFIVGVIFKKQPQAIPLQGNNTEEASTEPSLSKSNKNVTDVPTDGNSTEISNTTNTATTSESYTTDAKQDVIYYNMHEAIKALESIELCSFLQEQTFRFIPNNEHEVGKHQRLSYDYSK